MKTLWKISLGGVSAFVLALAAQLAVAESAESVVSAGICPELGCVGGEVKCAEGTIHYPNGVNVNFTCYTTEGDPPEEPEG